MAMNDPDAARLFAGIAQRLEEAQQLADAGGSTMPAHYAALLAQVEHALPQVQVLYAQNLARLSPPTLPQPASEAAPARTRSSRPRPPADLHTAMHQLRRDFYEIVHPLEVLGKWPPDGWTDKPPQPAGGAKRAVARGIAKWPPPGF